MSQVQAGCSSNECPENARCCGSDCDGVSPTDSANGTIPCDTETLPTIGSALTTDVYGFQDVVAGVVTLKYSCTCRAWYTRIERYSGLPGDRLESVNYEIAASFADEDDRCAEPTVWPPPATQPVDNGHTTYWCFTGENALYNNMQGSSMPTGCGWVRIREVLPVTEPQTPRPIRFWSCSDINHPPDCSAAKASPEVVTPEYAEANGIDGHEDVPVDVVGVTDPDGDPITITIDACSSSQPENTTGDGNTAPDCSGIGGSNATILRERRGDDKADRVYTVEFTAKDSRGLSCTLEGGVQVTVPARRPPLIWRSSLGSSSGTSAWT